MNKAFICSFFWVTRHLRCMWSRAMVLDNPSVSLDKAIKALKSLSLIESHWDLEPYTPELKCLKIEIVSLIVFWMQIDVFLLFQTPDCIWESDPKAHPNVLCSQCELIPCQASWSNAFVYASNLKENLFEYLMWLFKSKLILRLNCSKDERRSSANASIQCSASVAARKLLVETQQQCFCNCGPRVDEIMESFYHPSLTRRAGTRDAQGCGWPVMPGPWGETRTELSRANPPGRLAWFPGPSASVHGWSQMQPTGDNLCSKPDDYFNLIKYRSCCGAGRSTSSAELRVCAGGATSQVVLAQEKSTAGRACGKKISVWEYTLGLFDLFFSQVLKRYNSLEYSIIQGWQLCCLYHDCHLCRSDSEIQRMVYSLAGKCTAYAVARKSLIVLKLIASKKKNNQKKHKLISEFVIFRSHDF